MICLSFFINHDDAIWDFMQGYICQNVSEDVVTVCSDAALIQTDYLSSQESSLKTWVRCRKRLRLTFKASSIAERKVTLNPDRHQMLDYDIREF